MQTNFTPQQRADPRIAEADAILRTCVHCGFCTATCPTYVLLGDERDSPRGRIYMIKDMLENDRPAGPDLVRHVDRCLSCLGCMTTCPSGVDYRHLVDHARHHIEQTYRRPLPERALRRLLAFVLTRPGLFRWALRGAALGRPIAGLLPGRLKGLVAMAPRRVAAADRHSRPGVFSPRGKPTARVALLPGCAQQVLAPEINAATIRLLNRCGVEVVIAPDTECCGALTHHMGHTDQARARARRTIAAWWTEVEGRGLDAVITNTSGCGNVVKDYGHLLGEDQRAARIAALTVDISEFLVGRDLPAVTQQRDITIAYHPACTLQHGQAIKDPPLDLLRAAGFTVRLPAESHMCCGSAGTYNMLQPDLAARLGDRKAGHLRNTGATVIATGNIGCQSHIGHHLDLPVVHTVELLDWATGGPRPPAIDAS